MKKFGLSNNQLKLIALLTMTVDHVGASLFPQVIALRIIGRLAYPIFAYMIAEGCLYTKSPRKYLGTMVALAVLCQTVYFLFAGSLYQYIPVTFSLSIGLVFLMERARKMQTAAAWSIFGAGMLAVLFVTEILPGMLPGTDFAVDYGFFGVMLPVLVYLGKNKWQKLAVTAVVLVLIWLNSASIQVLSMLALPVLALYNGQRGKWRLKWLFYIYYPAHLAAIYIVAWLLQ